MSSREDKPLPPAKALAGILRATRLSVLPATLQHRPFIAVIMEAFLSGEAPCHVIEHDPELAVPSDHRRNSQLSIATKFAKTVLGEKLPLQDYAGGVYFLRLVTSGRTCVDALSVMALPAGMAPPTMYNLLRTQTLREVLRLEHVQPFRYTQPAPRGTEGLANILETLTRIGHTKDARTACTVMHCEDSGRAMACLYVDALQVYVVFDPSPPSPRLIPGVIQGGATFFCHRTFEGVVDCVQSLFLGKPLATLSLRARENAQNKDRAEGFVFSGR